MIGQKPICRTPILGGGIISSAVIDFSHFVFQIYTMVVQQTIEIPADRRVYLDIPPGFPLGKARIEITDIPAEQEFAEYKKDSAEQFPGNGDDPRTIVEAKEQAARRAAAEQAGISRNPFEGLFGSLKDSPHFGRSGLEIQRELRSEWNRDWDIDGQDQIPV
jgi:hypothetical protein